MTETEKGEALAEAMRLLAAVNEAEADDPELYWRPWRITRESGYLNG